MTKQRRLIRTYQSEAHPGFLGRYHLARPVVQGTYQQTDPFIMLMDDVLDKKDDEPVGGPHPHAGFETVSLLLEGEIGDAVHGMKSGDFQIMTAGSGIVHTETIEKQTKMHLLQLWLNLPRKDRSATPRVQDLPAGHVPGSSENGVKIKLYSGSFAGLVSPIHNHVPLIVAELTLDPGATTLQQLPGDFNTFLYVLEGSVQVGDDKKPLQQHQVGWLDLFDNGASSLKLTAGHEGVRLVLYSGEPLHEEIVSHGPFIADSSEDISRLYHEYRQGKLKHISTVPEDQRILW